MFRLICLIAISLYLTGCATTPEGDGPQPVSDVVDYGSYDAPEIETRPLEPMEVAPVEATQVEAPPSAPTEKKTTGKALPARKVKRDTGGAVALEPSEW